MFDSWRENSVSLSYAWCTIVDIRSLLVFVLSVLTLVYFSLTYNKKSAPGCGAWIPWLGCALQFGKQPLEYIGKKRKELGPVFTLKVAGENLTFISEVEDFHHFFQSKDTSFQLAVQEPVQKLASVSEELFFQAHTRLHDKVKSHFAPTNIGEMVVTLTRQLNKQMTDCPSAEQDLMETVRCVMYKSVLNTIWGDDNPLANTEAGYKEFVEKFKIFDEDFELGVKLPSWLLPKWCRARAYFLDRMQYTVNVMKGQSSKSKQSLIDGLWDILNGENVHGFAMLVMFASLANAIPASCWLLIYVLTDDTVYSRVMKEIDEVMKDKTDDDFELTEEDLRKMKYLCHCVYETLRLRCEGVIGRRVVKTINIKGYDIPAGNMLMISPYWTHRDPRYFEEPDVFNPHRWENLSLDMKAFVPFGGGRYMCPGRWFGMMSMQAFVAMFLHKYKCTAKSQAPRPSTKHVIGVQHTAAKFLVSCEKRT